MAPLMVVSTALLPLLEVLMETTWEKAAEDPGVAVSDPVSVLELVAAVLEVSGVIETTAVVEASEVALASALLWSGISSTVGDALSWDSAVIP